MKKIRIVTLDNGTSLKIVIKETATEFGNHVTVVELKQSDPNKVIKMTLSQPEAITLAEEIAHGFSRA